MDERETEAFEVIRKVFAGELEREAPVEAGQHLRDLALDSMEVTVLMVELENHFRVRLDAADAIEVATVADLARLVAARAQAAP
ncbi:acyl carrier protein [Chondromyces apiculatus]|uniref:Acyl carrier protein n=1 Tax=Chondromyces apiculatus DSM 436 TaxID=1192034 RepID=A0A017TC98_9BACT|nr:acyl carrier protein [Chondromyces apiculatus]EYF06522.1 Acyl carrier protein [Chondromyces apiculatus DSM 436]